MHFFCLQGSQDAVVELEVAVTPPEFKIMSLERLTKGSKTLTPKDDLPGDGERSDIIGQLPLLLEWFLDSLEAKTVLFLRLPCSTIPMAISQGPLLKI